MNFIGIALPAPQALLSIRGTIAVVLTAALALTGCSGLPVGPNHAIRNASEVNLSGFSPAYRTGFDSGCQRAHAGGKVGEAPIFGNAPAQTVQGWRDGFDICSRR